MAAFGGYYSKDALIDEVATSHGRQVMIEKSVRGNHLWILYRNDIVFFVPEHDMSTLKAQGIKVPFVSKRRHLKPFHYIELCIMSKSDNMWQYKSISEFEGPYHYTCPLKFIKISDVTTEFSKAWKERFYKFTDNKKAVSKAKYGDVFMVKTSKGRYPVKFHYKSNGGFVGKEMAGSDCTDKQLYRYDYSHIV